MKFLEGGIGEIQNPKLLNGLTLAYMGDAVLELFIRQQLIASGKVKPNKLHKIATSYVSAKAQSYVISQMLETDFLTEEEQGIVMRGRNAKSATSPKNTNIQDYRYSTGYEALLGYLFMLKREDRLEEILVKSMETIDRKE
jgi:ribonuclease III family protein